jgi:sucrose phosphorylase
VRRREGFVSTKNNADGTQSPYEMNITYFDAFADPEQRSTGTHVMKFLCSQTAALALAGIPGIYFHNLVATGNDLEGVKRTGHARSINRKKLDAEALCRRLDDPESVQHKVFSHYTRLLQIRSSHPAFHPEGAQRVIDMGPSLFAVERTSPDEDESLLAVSNFSAEETTVSLEKSFPALRYAPSWMDCISGRVHQGGCRRIQLAPYQTAWIIPL